jgi:hypothetical protein
MSRSPDLPLGGTTGLCHQSSAAVAEAASWYAANPHAERPLVSTLRQRFGLTTAEACAALAEGGRLLAGFGSVR